MTIMDDQDEPNGTRSGSPGAQWPPPWPPAGRHRDGQAPPQRVASYAPGPWYGGGAGEQPTMVLGSGVALAERPPPSKRHGHGHGFGDRVRFLISGLGQTLITTGLVLLLFVVYEVWVTNIFANQKQARVASTLQQTWAQGDDPLMGKTKLELPPGEQVTLPVGQGFANMYIPAFGKDYAKTIVEGTDDAQLEEGPGHYPGSAIPGQVGNFAVAGHRVGKGEPFLNLDQLKAGDNVVVETADTWFIYTVLGDTSTGDPTVKDATGLPGREIVSPQTTSVIAANPVNPGTPATRKLITLTTCHPKYTANQRMIIHGELTKQVPRSGGALPVELGGTL